jgi:hypothetical protein
MPDSRAGLAAALLLAALCLVGAVWIADRYLYRGRRRPRKLTRHERIELWGIAVVAGPLLVGSTQGWRALATVDGAALAVGVSALVAALVYLRSALARRFPAIQL